MKATLNVKIIIDGSKVNSKVDSGSVNGVDTALLNSIAKTIDDACKRVGTQIVRYCANSDSEGTVDGEFSETTEETEA